MKCLKCTKSYDREYKCPFCGHMKEEVMIAHDLFNSFANRDEGVRTLVTGLMVLKIDTSASCQGGLGHIKDYPWIEIVFPSNNEKMKRLSVILKTYHMMGSVMEWVIEMQIGGIYWLVPAVKNLPLDILHEGAEDLGWFLYQTRDRH